MTFLSADEDFLKRTLGAFEGAVEKLAYLARLRGEEGHYAHWGMSRTYGERAADAAMNQAHTKVWHEVLRTPIPELLRQMGGLDARARTAVIEQIREDGRRAYPTDLSGGAVRHFNSILLALGTLSRSKGAIHRGA